jgi:hypothetical protein
MINAAGSFSTEYISGFSAERMGALIILPQMVRIV